MTLSAPEFTAHNIVLDDGTQTFPSIGMAMSDYPWFKSAKRLLEMLYPGDRSAVRVADLGCLEGGYATEFARMGFQSVGIEVRQSNIAACNYVKQRVDLPNLSFVCDDVWNLEQYGPFDVIFCCGLLYHLDRPRAFIDLMSRCCRRAMLIQTHFATDRPSQVFTLSEMTNHEGLAGRRYFEHNEVSPDQLDGMKWSSWTNTHSFWIKHEYLLHAIRSAGFDTVLEVFDCLGDDIAQAMGSGVYKTHDRGMFVGIRSGQS